MRVGGDADDCAAGARSSATSVADDRARRAVFGKLSPNTFTVPYTSSANRRLTTTAPVSPAANTRPDTIGMRMTAKFLNQDVLREHLHSRRIVIPGLEHPSAQRSRRDDRGSLDLRIRGDAILDRVAEYDCAAFPVMPYRPRGIASTAARS